jgi:hypothetical protein
VEAKQLKAEPMKETKAEIDQLAGSTADPLNMTQLCYWQYDSARGKN